MVVNYAWSLGSVWYSSLSISFTCKSISLRHRNNHFFSCKERKPCIIDSVGSFICARDELHNDSTMFCCFSVASCQFCCMNEQHFQYLKKIIIINVNGKAKDYALFCCYLMDGFFLYEVAVMQSAIYNSSVEKFKRKNENTKTQNDSNNNGTKNTIENVAQQTTKIGVKCALLICNFIVELAFRLLDSILIEWFS